MISPIVICYSSFSVRFFCLLLRLIVSVTYSHIISHESPTNHHISMVYVAYILFSWIEKWVSAFMQSCIYQHIHRNSHLLISIMEGRHYVGDYNINIRYQNTFGYHPSCKWILQLGNLIAWYRRSNALLHHVSVSIVTFTLAPRDSLHSLDNLRYCHCFEYQQLQK